MFSLQSHTNPPDHHYCIHFRSIIKRPSMHDKIYHHTLSDATPSHIGMPMAVHYRCGLLETVGRKKKWQYVLMTQECQLWQTSNDNVPITSTDAADGPLLSMSRHFVFNPHQKTFQNLMLCFETNFCWSEQQKFNTMQIPRHHRRWVMWINISTWISHW